MSLYTLISDFPLPSIMVLEFRSQMLSTKLNTDFLARIQYLDLNLKLKGRWEFSF